MVADEPPASQPDRMSRLAVLETRLDALASVNQQPKKPWYKEPSVIISAAAFIISIVTTVVSGYRTYRQDIEAQKNQLRTVLLQLNSGTLQAAELMTKYQKDPSITTISSALNVQNIITAKQAYVLVKTLGSDSSSLDYSLVSYALFNTREVILAEELAQRALEKASNATEYMGATRQMASIKASRGQTTEADIYFQKALKVFDRYPQEAINEQNVAYTHTWTQLTWASVSPNCNAAMIHVVEANKHLEALGPSGALDLTLWRDQFVKYCAPLTAGQPQSLTPPSIGPPITSDPTGRPPQTISGGGR